MYIPKDAYKIGLDALWMSAMIGAGMFIYFLGEMLYDLLKKKTSRKV